MADRIEISGQGPASELKSPGPDGPVPLIRWGPETVEHRDLFDAWHEVVRPFFDTAPGGDPRAFRGGGTIAKMGELVVTEVDFTAQRFDRNCSHIADTDSFSLQLYTRGSLAGTIGDMPCHMAPDRIGLFDFSHELHTLAPEPSVVLGASIPRDLVDTSAASDSPGILWSRESTAGRLLIGALKILREDVERLSEAEAAEAAAGFIGLLNGLLGSRRDAHDPSLVSRACLATMERYIEHHLHQPELDAAALCRAFCSSRSRLYDLFKEHGGVERYLRECRLARCFRDLAKAEPATIRVREIAERWGFFDQSHFNRLFKQEFALRPSDVLASGARGRPSVGPHHAELRRGMATAHQWFRSL